MEVTSPDMGENWIWSAKGDIGEMSAKADGDILEGVMPGDLPGVALPGVMGPATPNKSLSCKPSNACLREFDCRSLHHPAFSETRMLSGRAADLMGSNCPFMPACRRQL